MPGRKLGGHTGAWALIAQQQACAGDGEPEGQVFHLWPENVPVYELWRSVQTQWFSSGFGPTGLNYPSIRAKPYFRSIGGARKRERLLSDVEFMEGVFLAERGREERKRQAEKAGDKFPPPDVAGA